MPDCCPGQTMGCQDERFLLAVREGDGRKGGQGMSEGDSQGVLLPNQADAYELGRQLLCRFQDSHIRRVLKEG